ncbi:unnamed protein product [Closterium sp. NIES-54]
MAVVEEPLYPIAILIDELKNDDIQLRLNSIRRLSTIARALGDDRTRKELIPFLNENNDDDDEVLLAMAEELGSFIPYVGGVDYAPVLLPPLETLCTVEETVVRDKAVESLCKIGQQMKPRDVVEFFVPLVQVPCIRQCILLEGLNFECVKVTNFLKILLYCQRLGAGEWFTARVSACGLFHIAYPSATEQQRADLRTLYGQLSHDDMPMVRRSSALNMGKFAATVEPQFLKLDILEFFKDLTNDDQDSVRLLAVEGCAAVGKLLEKKDCISSILPVILSFAQDKSWRVRYMVANQLHELCEAVGPEVARAELVPAYVKLLRDNEAEVRIAAAGKTLEDWYKQMPIITRSYLTLSFLTTAGCALEVISPFSVYFNSNLIFKKFQLWRLFTNFFFFGSIGIDFVFHMFFLCRYCKLLEETSFRGRTADFFFMLLFGGVLLTMVAPFVNIQFLGSSLTFMMVYVWGRRNPNIQMSFLGLFNFTAPYLPWVLLGFSVLLGSSPVVDLLGMAAGHVYYFLVDVYPKISGRQLLKTPGILKVLFPPDDVVVAFPPEEAGFDQAAGVNGHM